MTHTKLKTAGIAAGSVITLLLSGVSHAQTTPSEWKFSVMPYVWLPSFSADLKYGPPPSNGASANVEADEEDVLSKLEGAFMIAGEARKGPWLALTDYMYLHLGDVNSKVKSVDFNPGSGPVNIGTSQIGGSADSSLKGSVWTLAGGYAILDDASTSLDLIAGFRYLDLEFASDWSLNADVTLPSNTQTFTRSGDADKSGSVTTFIMGAKGQFKLGQSEWFIPYYADLGGDGSTFTWQLAAGVGYRFNWGDVRLDYRHLAYEQDDDELMQNVELSGFALGANFIF